MKWTGYILLVVLALLVSVAATSRTDGCWGRCATQREKQEAKHAIRYVFQRYSSQAMRVAGCESGFSIRAYNGQYLGLFQMGSSERRAYGHGPTAWEQTIAAYRYFVASGKDWSPWSCKP